MRIFNAFSIYTITDNNQEVGNTYNNIGFNKIILVCDFDNVKNFFKHVYGDRTDIRGYFDKFIDKQVFYFTNNGEIKKFIKEIVDGKYISSSTSSDQKDYEIEISSLQNILSDLYFNGLINLRELQVFDYRIKSYQRRPYSVPSKWGKLYSRKVPGLLLIETMYILLDFDWERIKNAFYQLSYSNNLVTDRNLIIDYSYFIPLLGDNLITESESSKFGANGKSFEGTYKTTNDRPNIEFHLKFRFESSYTLIDCSISSKELEEEENNHKHFNKINLVQELNHLIYNTLLELEKNAYPRIAKDKIKSQFIARWHDKVSVLKKQSKL